MPLYTVADYLAAFPAAAALTPGLVAPPAPAGVNHNIGGANRTLLVPTDPLSVAARGGH